MGDVFRRILCFRLTFLRPDLSWYVPKVKHHLYVHLGIFMQKPRRKTGRPPSPTPRVSITIRVDPEVLAHFRAGGAGYQTRINEALRRAIRKDAK
jgi:uncharacterized protein (DUF4415 family)